MKLLKKNNKNQRQIIVESFKTRPKLDRNKTEHHYVTTLWYIVQWCFFFLQAVLADLTTLQVIPLIQLSLFSKWVIFLPDPHALPKDRP